VTAPIATAPGRARQEAPPGTDQIDDEAALDGFYVLRTPLPASQLDGPAVVAAYKNLKYAERDFRHIKSDDLDLRPVFHRLEERVKAHVLICMLACYLTWHLRKAWAPLTFTDENPPGQASPVPPPAAPPPPRPRPPASAIPPATPTAGRHPGPRQIQDHFPERGGRAPSLMGPFFLGARVRRPDARVAHRTQPIKGQP